MCKAKGACTGFTHNAYRQVCSVYKCGAEHVPFFEPSTEFDRSGLLRSLPGSSSLPISSGLWRTGEGGRGAKGSISVAFLILGRATWEGRQRLMHQFATWGRISGEISAGMLVLLDPSWMVASSEAHNNGAGAIRRMATTLAMQTGRTIRVMELSEHDLLQGQPKEDGVAGKVLPGLAILMREFPDASHFAVLDDDTYVLVHNWRIFLNFYSNAGGGSPTAALGAMWHGERAAGGSFLHGGAGIVLPKQAALKIVVGARSGTCRTCSQNAGDVRLSCCALATGVPLSHEEGFQHSTPLTAAKLGAYLRAPFPLTFHAMDPPLRAKGLHAAVMAAVQRAPEEPTWWSDIVNVSASS